MKRLSILLCFLFLLPVASALEITNLEVLELGDSGFVIGWQTDEPTSSQILYGTNGYLGSSTSVENILKTDHQIQINNLDSDQIYFFRATGKNSRNRNYHSAIGVTKTNPKHEDSNSLGIESFWLVNADTNEDMFKLYDGQKIDLNSYDNTISVIAKTYGAVGSVSFFVNDQFYNVQGLAPWSINLDVNTFDILPWNPPLGTTKIQARSFTGRAVAGQEVSSGLEGEQKTITVEFINNQRPKNIPVTQPPSSAPPPTASGTEKNTLFTSSAKSILQNRLQTGFKTTSLHFDDFSELKREVQVFNANPAESRHDFFHGKVGEPIPELGSLSGGYSLNQLFTFSPSPDKAPIDRPYRAAIYAYLTDDVTTANNVMRELIWHANNDDLDPSNGRSKTNNKHGTFIRWRHDESLGTNNPLFVTIANVGKWMEAYELVKDIETVSSANDRARVEQWFKDFKDFSLATSRRVITSRLGSDWQNENYYFGSFSSSEISGNSRPIQTANGNTDTRFIMTWLQDTFNNRRMDLIDYIHAYGIAFNDKEAKEFSEDVFRAYFKFAVFTDGTQAEMYRTSSSNPEGGVFYNQVSASHLVKMAHRHAVAVENNFPSVAGESPGKLYDYTTADGVVRGSSSRSSSYAGSSTTDGRTRKGLFLVLNAISKYYRTSNNGGWMNQRYYAGNQLTGRSRNTFSFLSALANQYYDDSNLYAFYTFDTSKGYPVYKDSWIGAWNRERGTWGMYYGLGFWSKMENSFFS